MPLATSVVEEEVLTSTRRAGSLNFQGTFIWKKMSMTAKDMAQWTKCLPPKSKCEEEFASLEHT